MATLSARVQQLINGFRYIAKGDFGGLIARLKWKFREQTNAKAVRRVLKESNSIWGILCTPHTFSIAELISVRLAHHGISSEIIVGELKEFKHDFYIVLCAQMFKGLPPATKRVVFQLEQSVSSRWFTGAYFKTLNESLAVLEYSLINIEFLRTNGIKYPSVYYLPIGASNDLIKNTRQEDKKYDFVFYGDSLSSERRRKFLDLLASRYTVKICNNLFGEEMHNVIKQAKAVINIHYYEGALLEMPRICECLSVGVPVLSEGTNDQIEYPELIGAVEFFDENSSESMMATAEAMLANIEQYYSEVSRVASKSNQRFNFMFDRFLVGLGILEPKTIIDEPIYLPEEGNVLALSLPETIQRRLDFVKEWPENCVVFDGIRYAKGWVGCASSFSSMARYALENEFEYLIVLEDDAVLPSEFKNTTHQILDYLSTQENGWDIFSGLMANIHPETRVLNVQMVGERTYVTIDRMMSMVFNIYHKRVLELLTTWDATNFDAATNTIDKFLERQSNLRIVVALPFIAGHKEEATSTLWGFENERYSPMIAAAEARLRELADEWLRQNGH